MKYQLREKDGVITAELPIPLDDGRQLVIRASERIEDVAKELGFDPRTIAAGEAIVGWNPFKAIGKVVKKIAKSKVVRSVVKVGKSVLKSPLTTAALGAVTGGAAIAPMAAANMAIRLAETAAKAGKKGVAAAKVLRGAVKAADKHSKQRAAIQRLNSSTRGKLMNPRALSRLQATMMRRKLLAAKLRKLRMQRLATLAKKGSKQAQLARATDFLVNVHLK